MFWDGTRWIDERPTTPPARASRRGVSPNRLLLVLFTGLLIAPPLAVADASRGRGLGNHGARGKVEVVASPAPSTIAGPPAATQLPPDPTSPPADSATPTAQLTSTPAPTPHVTPSADPTEAPTPDDQPPSTPSPTPRVTPRPDPTEAPTPAPTPTPTPAPTPAPTDPAPVCGSSLQVAIDRTPTGSELDVTGCSFSGSVKITRSVHVTGGTLTVPSGATGVTIRSAGVTIEGMKILGNGTAYAGIWASGSQDVVVRRVTVSSFVYAGVMFISVSGGSIVGSTIRNIGVTGWQANNMNAYGIALTDTGGAPTSDVLVDGNVIDNVPTWEGIDSHGGRRLTITDNVIHRTNRAIRLVGSANGAPQDIIVSRNTMDSPTRRPDVLNQYPYNEVGITVVSQAIRVSGSGNIFDGWPAGNHIDVQGGSSSFSNSVIRNSI